MLRYGTMDQFGVNKNTINRTPYFSLVSAMEKWPYQIINQPQKEG